MTSLDGLRKRVNKIEQAVNKDREQAITISDAQIMTATIEVRVMKIGNRQVTLAVFRQLPDKQIIDKATGLLGGVPWGRVNYHVDCETDKQHLHIVWQKDNNLYRSIVRPSSWYRGVHSERWKQVDHTMGEYEKAYVVSRILEGWVPSCNHPDLPTLPEPYIFTLVDRKVILYLPDKVKGAWSRWNDGSVHIYREKELSEILYTVTKKNIQSITSQEIATQFWLPLAREREDLEEREEQVLQAWQQSYAQLEQLDQLFIAV